jgi:hypothetical protein
MLSRLSANQALYFLLLWKCSPMPECSRMPPSGFPRCFARMSVKSCPSGLTAQRWRLIG